jgi:hypothetical protein
MLNSVHGTKVTTSWRGIAREILQSTGKNETKKEVNQEKYNGLWNVTHTITNYLE